MKTLLTILVVVVSCSVFASEQNDRGYAIIAEAGSLGPEKGAERIVQLSESKDSESRMLAASIIGYFPYESQIAVYVRVLEKLLKDKSPEVQIEAVSVCPDLGARAAPLLPLLSKLRKSENKEVRRVAKVVYPQIKGYAEIAEKERHQKERSSSETK